MEIPLHCGTLLLFARAPLLPFMRALLLLFVHTLLLLFVHTLLLLFVHAPLLLLLLGLFFSPRSRLIERKLSLTRLLLQLGLFGSHVGFLLGPQLGLFGLAFLLFGCHNLGV